MLAYCMIEGLTVGERLLKVGDIFVLPPILEKEVADKSDEQIGRWSIRNYSKKLIFRRPTPEEMMAAYHAKKLKLTDCDKKEKAALGRIIMSAAERQKRAAEVLTEQIGSQEDLEDDLEELKKEGVNPASKEGSDLIE